MKYCPHCGAENSDELFVCHVCGEEMTPETEIQRPKKSSMQKLLRLGAVLFGVLFLGAMVLTVIRMMNPETKLLRTMNRTADALVQQIGEVDSVQELLSIDFYNVPVTETVLNASVSSKTGRTIELTATDVTSTEKQQFRGELCIGSGDNTISADISIDSEQGELLISIPQLFEDRLLGTYMDMDGLFSQQGTLDEDWITEKLQSIEIIKKDAEQTDAGKWTPYEVHFTWNDDPSLDELGIADEQIFDIVDAMLVDCVTCYVDQKGYLVCMAADCTLGHWEITLLGENNPWEKVSICVDEADEIIIDISRSDEELDFIVNLPDEQTATLRYWDKQKKFSLNILDLVSIDGEFSAQQERTEVHFDGTASCAGYSIDLEFDTKSAQYEPEMINSEGAQIYDIGVMTDQDAEDLTMCVVTAMMNDDSLRELFQEIYLLFVME